MIHISGYDIQEKIRQNRNIDIYHASRVIDRCKVMLKIPHNLYASSDNLAILQYEYHLLSKIKVPAIIKAYDFVQNLAAPVLILEGVEGQLLSSYLIGHRLEMNEFFNLALQLVDILGELHKRNIVHKEIIPANLIVDPEKLNLTLVDLSASSKLNEEHFDYLNLNKYGEVLAYISPEQTGRINRPVDYRTDFYSLGITLYEMLTNQLPFATNDTLELVHCHIAKKPKNVLEIRPNTPKMLAAIIDKLLEKMPEERYSSIIGLKTDIQECYKQWLNKNNVSIYSLGSNDIRDHLSISHSLYGRTEQVHRLIEAYNRVSQGTKEIVFVAGYSGIGKTSLVREVHKPIVHHKGYYIQGKFDQLQRNVPYSAIVSAFQSLVQQVLSESEARLNAIKRQLVDSLGNIGQVVIDVIPEVELIIGPQPPINLLNPTDTQIRFNLVFQNFVRVFAQADHPLVMFLDDLQWADNSSINFIENLLQDRETNYLLIIGAYRDNEIHENHLLQLSINNLSKNQVETRTLILEPLNIDNIQHLLQDTLCGSLEEIKSLAQCIFNKTQGNPFFINEFLKIIYQEHLLVFSYEQGAWEWDLAKIQHQSATDNVIELLTAKIHLLKKNTQEILKLGACFGHQFEFNTLLLINGQTISENAEQLAEAIKANIIYPLEESYKTLGLVGLNEHYSDINIEPLSYRFAHDKLQQATYELIAEKDRPSYHLKIGRLLLEEKPLEEHDERLFNVLKHFNQCISLIHDSDERLMLAKYNFWAAKKAKTSAAYYAADVHLSVGVELLDQDNWKKNYALAFQLYKEFAVCKYQIGDFTTADHFFSELLHYSRSSLDSLEIYKLKIEMLSTLGKHTESLKIGLTALRKFNIKIPEKPNTLHILTAIYKIRFQLKNTKIEDVDLPPMVDLQQRSIVDLITQILNSAFVTNQQLFVLLTCKNISLSLAYGYTESTSMCISAYAFIIMHSLDLFDDSISFIKLYERLKHEYGESKFEGKNQFIIGSFIEPYQSPITACNKRVTNAFKLCCDVGDLVYSNYCGLLIITHSLSSGKSLGEVKKNIQFALSFMLRMTISDFITLIKFWEYLTQCLENPELVHVEKAAIFEKNIINGASKTELSFFYGTLTRLYFLLGNFEKAMKTGEQHELYADYDKGFVCHLDTRFFFALSLFCYFPQLPKMKRKFYLKKLRKIGLLINKYATWCPNNYKAYSLLMAAEFARLEQNYDSALVFYEQAIEEALANDLIILAAVANERAGNHYVTIKVERVAKLYLQNALRYFKDWGALTKVKLLEQTYPTLLFDPNSSNLNTNSVLSNTPTPQTQTQNLDMLSIFKFTQLIASEIRLDKLLQKLLVIVLENAGAQRSIILSKVDEQWIVEAEGNTEQQIIYLNSSKRTETVSKYPISILNYVQRTQKPIIINDAVQSELTLHDSYVHQENPRSLLMMPLFYKGQLCRMLYLENKSSSHTFTPSHLDSLQLLASQAMTSLENAKLYYQATHDPLTGLANRNLLYEIFQHTTNQMARSQGKIALLFLDLDYFKAINDTLGHDIGDNLLIHIAKTLTTNLREGDIAARIGGDEFTIMLANIGSNAQLSAIIERLFNEIAKPAQINEHLVQVSCSMGVSIFPKDGHDIQTLLKLADTALYQAKEKGRSQFHYYSIALHDEYNRLHGLSKELQQAYEQKEFFLMYQPIYNTSSQIIGVESLLRWNHPKKGILEAKDFIHILEKHPLIIPVSTWIIKKVCQQAKSWQDQKILAGPIAINVSATQFIRHSISKVIADELAETQISASCIELEITETVFIDFNEKLHKEIDSLQKMGINLVIDDFGTGYSNLSYLTLLPISKIKIDKVFINKNHDEYFDKTIISAIVTMAHKLNIQVIAEGVETETQLRLLQGQHIDGIQGYYYSPPLTVEVCEEYLKR